MGRVTVVIPDLLGKRFPRCAEDVENEVGAGPTG
jgi:hypothetical protein